MLIPLAATVFAASAAASSAPRGLGFARTASTEQKMFYTAQTWNPSGNVLYSLDLTVPWPVSMPTWTKLPFIVSDELEPFTTDTLALSSNESKLHFLSNTKRGSYDPLSAEWTVCDRPKYHDLLGVFHAVVIDTDDDVLYALEENIDYYVSEEALYSMENEGDLDMDWLPKADTLLRLNMKNDTLSRERISDLLEYTKGGQAEGGIYSSERKSLVFLVSTTETTSLFEYHIPTKAIRPVVASGDIPPPRFNTLTISAYRGKKLILVSGIAPTREPSSKFAQEERVTKYTNNVHVFDIETSTWTRMADIPVQYSTTRGASSGDHLVLYGILHDQENHAHGPGCHCDVGVHTVLNLKENVWVDHYTPQGSVV